MSAVPPSALAPVRAEIEDGRHAGEGGLQQQAVGEQQQLALVEPVHRVEEGARAVERGGEAAALHAGARVEQQDGGEGHIAALEGDELLARPLVEDREVRARVAAALAALLDGDVELAQVDLDEVVGGDDRSAEQGAGDRAGGVVGDRLEAVLGVGLADVHHDAVGRRLDHRGAPAVEVDLDLGERRPRRRHRHPHLDLAEHRLAVGRADEGELDRAVALQGRRAGGAGLQQRREQEGQEGQGEQAAGQPSRRPHLRPPRVRAGRTAAASAGRRSVMSGRSSRRVRASSSSGSLP